MTPKSEQNRSQKLSYLLRHKPEQANLSIDKEGWVEVGELIAKTDFTEAELVQIVANDSKIRYSFSADKLFIRANQGHSTSAVKMAFERVHNPPSILYHGTSVKLFETIMKEGLKPMNRHHVHLSSDFKVARTVGARRTGTSLVLQINVGAMVLDKIQFFISENGVFLTDFVHPKYIQKGTI